MCTVTGAACGFGCVYSAESTLKPTLEILICCICDAVQFDVEEQGFWRKLQTSLSKQLIHNHFREYTAPLSPTECNIKPTTTDGEHAENPKHVEFLK
jgi:hypothetical protein